MAISIVPLTAADRQRLLDVDLAAFFFDPTAHPVDIVTSHFDWARTFGATRDGSDELAGVYTSYDMAVTAPLAAGCPYPVADGGVVVGVSASRPSTPRRPAPDDHPPFHPAARGRCRPERVARG